MNIEQYRPSFTVFLMDKHLERCNQVHLALKRSGYTIDTCLSAEQFFTKTEGAPPHMLFVEQDTLIVLGEDFVAHCLQKLPELHIVVYADHHEIFSASHFYQMGVYDCVPYMQNNPSFIIRAADRAAERDYYMYMNEQILESHSNVESSSSDDQNFGGYEHWLSQLNEKKTMKEVVDLFLEEVSQNLEGKEVIFLKYIPSHQSLVASQSVVTDIQKVRGMGFELSKEEKGFSLDQLHRPMSLQGLRKMLKSVLNISKYYATPLIVQGVPEGIFVFVDCDPLVGQSAFVRVYLKALTLKVAQINLLRKLHSVSIHDDKTRVLNRENFIDSLKREISRSRRLAMPVALILLSLDDFVEFSQRLTEYEVDTLLKMCATILKRHSRVNDIVGRVNRSEFGVILPHTGKLGGAIKAERLRKIFESADFTKVIPSHKFLTISVGVSEYPSHCRDYEDILHTADEALEEVRRSGANKVCLASAPHGFIPDFVLDGTKL